MVIKKSRKHQVRTASSIFILYSLFAVILSALMLSSLIIDIALGIPNRYYVPLKPVVNHPPVVKAGPNQTIAENATVVLNGIASDPDSGDKLSYSWRQMAGHSVKLSSSTTTNPSFTAPNVSADTQLEFAFMAKDDKGATSITPAIVAITVKHMNRPPVADAGTNQTVNTGYFVTLNGSKSKDPDGTITSYLWKQIGGPNVTLNRANTPIATFTAPKDISSDTDLVFGLTVIDNKNASSTANVKVTDTYIPPPNKPPVANAGTNQTVNPGDTVTLDGSGSHDPDGNIASYSWKQTSGPIVLLTGSDRDSKTFSAPSVSSNTTLVFSLTVTDNKGTSSAPANVAITVKPRQTTATGSMTTIGGNVTSGAVARFMSTGTINSLIHTPKAQWIATGKWRMTVDNGSLKYFETNMTWFNSNGTSSHTHEFRNLNVGGKIITVQPGNSLSLKGVMDVGTNHHIVWRNVPTTIDIHGGKTIIISVDDKATNHHFAGQPILAVVNSVIQCSDIPGPNMEVLPSCSPVH